MWKAGAIGTGNISRPRIARVRFRLSAGIEQGTAFFRPDRGFCTQPNRPIVCEDAERIFWRMTQADDEAEKQRKQIEAARKAWRDRLGKPIMTEGLDDPDRPADFWETVKGKRPNPG